MKRALCIFLAVIVFAVSFSLVYWVFSRHRRLPQTTGRCVPAEGFKRNRENCLASVSIFILAAPVEIKEGLKFEFTAAGSGFAISKDGLVVTSAHLFADGDEERPIIVRFETPEGASRWEHATLESVDYAWDIAIISVPYRFPEAVRLGLSQGLRPGSPVYAITTLEGGEADIFSQGYFSALTVDFKNRRVKSLLLDLSITSGSSGGGVFDQKGNLVGLVKGVAQRKFHTWEYTVPVEYIHVFLQRRVCAIVPFPTEEPKPEAK